MGTKHAPRRDPLQFPPRRRAPNDDFTNATVITGDDYQIITSNLGGTKETGEPNHGGLTNGRTLWWKWTAPESGTFIVSTAGNMYDDYNARRTGLGVYTGTAVNALATVVSNQNGAGPNSGDHTWSAASFTAVEGTTYHFGVDSAFAGNLSFLLTRPAPNDNFANATVMAGSRWTTTGHNLMSTVEPGESKIEWFGNPPPVNNSTVRSVWWRWTAPVSGTISLDTLGSQLYNVMGVYTGSAIGALTPVVVTNASGDYLNGEGPNRARNGTKRVTFDAVAGTTYQITIQGAGYTNASSGPIILSLDGPPAVPFAPEEFTALRTGASQIDLSWNDIAVDEEFYEIERSNNGSTWGPLHQTNPDVESHTDFDTAAAIDYFYRIRAVNSVGASAWVTASVTIPQPPPVPTNVGVTALSPHDLSINWTPAPTATRHRIDRSVDGGNTWTVLNNVGGTDTSYTDVGLTPATTYHYRVRAANELGSSPWATASGATQAPGLFTISIPESTLAETDGTFTATVTRAGSSGGQIVLLTSGGARLTVPASVLIPDGQTSAAFDVTINDDEIVNPTDSETIAAFAPAAVVGESFSGPSGAQLSGQNTGWGWGGAWTSVNASPILVEPSLTYTKNGNISTPGTRAARLVDTGSGGQGLRNFATKHSSGSVWVSTLLHRNSSNWNTNLIVRQNTNGGNWARVRYASNTLHWELEAGTGNKVQILHSNPSPSMLYVVMQFDFTARKVRAWLSPDVSGASPTNAIGSGEVDMQTGLDGVSRIDLVGNSNLDGFDEIRVATSFANLHGGISTSRNVRLIDDESTPILAPADQWLDTYFDTTNPIGLAAWDNDPDNDGVVNLLEYALGGDPWDPGSSPKIQSGFSNSKLQITFLRARADLTYQVLGSSELAGWALIATDPGRVGEEVTVGDSMSTPDHPRRFLILRILTPQ